MENREYKLLSPRISKGILKPENYLILNFSPLKRDILKWFEENKINASVYVLNLRDGASFGINEEKPFPPLSINKLALAILILKKVEKGILNLDDRFEILSEYKDNYGVLQDKKISEISLRDLLRHMLSKSDNTAANILGKNILLEELQSLSVYTGLYENNLNENLSGAEISAKSVSSLFISLYLSTILKPEFSEIILNDLIKNSFNIKKIASLPEEIIVSHKFAEGFSEEQAYFYDCGILYIGEARFFYAVMTKDHGIEDSKVIVGSVVNGIYSFVKDKIKN